MDDAELQPEPLVQNVKPKRWLLLAQGCIQEGKAEHLTAIQDWNQIIALPGEKIPLRLGGLASCLDRQNLVPPETKIEAFLTHLVVNKNVAPATQNQAMSARVFLYKRETNGGDEEVRSESIFSS